VLHDRVRPRIERASLRRVEPSESSWLAAVRDFLQNRSDPFFLLLLDDYGLCGTPRIDVIEAAASLLHDEPDVGLFPLCWYPARPRTRRPDHPHIDTLAGAPILLQAALWRRDWFLELSAHMPRNTSPWGFEALATQAAKRLPRQICAAHIPEPAFIGGPLIDGLDKADWPLPYHNLMRRGRRDDRHDEFLRKEGFAVPSRGLGDTIAKFTHAIGIDQLARTYEQSTGRPCGCKDRQEKLNRLLPYS
jgi:hypothetical protein